MMADDSLINARNLATPFYLDKGIGPLIKIPREADADFLKDELDAFQENSEWAKKYAKTLKILVTMFANSTAKEMNEGTPIAFKDGEAILKAFEDIGVRALRDYRMLTMLLEVLRKHYSNESELDHNEL